MKVTWEPDGYLITHDNEAIKLTGDLAVHLVQELYRLGLEFDMPSGDSYIQGKLEATEKHLADMRKLVMEGHAE